MTKIKYKIAELCISVGEGQLTITENNEIEFVDCTPMSIDLLESVLMEAKKFIEYRDERNKELRDREI